MTRKPSRRRASRSIDSEAPPGRAPAPLEVAARLLRRAPRTASELHARLLARGYGEGTATAVVERCQELGWVNDALVAGDRARYLRRHGAGSLRIAAELAARGLADEVIAEAVAASLDGESETAWARRVLERARPRQREGAAAWRLLAARGFPEEVIASVVGWSTD